MIAFIRLITSGIVAFTFYAAWAYYANSFVTEDESTLLKAALVQGVYSGSITLIFTFFLEFFFHIFKHKSYCLPFIVPNLVSPHLFSKECATTKTIENSLAEIEKACKGTCIPGMLLTPVPAIITQSVLVIGINVIFNTPNLWLTVAPSIFFSAIFGYIYSIGLTRKARAQQN
ncbi:hypothetical protein ISG33_00345 [Glaciecola sp. MH2013]|uniref:hypothetical protein n=1 Tax=Glaciecola sp. MH2013 TaxID=2785524 RepID=UPI0018A0EC6E|nr:hypothetical protein [Glaciecola sp. MH2013]MBF7071845.1 hypothetical protein [Glaciecola sp. MH2013]